MPTAACYKVIDSLTLQIQSCTAPLLVFELVFMHKKIVQHVLIPPVPFQSIRHDPVIVTHLVDSAFWYSPSTAVTSKKFR